MKFLEFLRKMLEEYQREMRVEFSKGIFFSELSQIILKNLNFLENSERNFLRNFFRICCSYSNRIFLLSSLSNDLIKLPKQFQKNLSETILKKLSWSCRSNCSRRNFQRKSRTILPEFFLKKFLKKKTVGGLPERIAKEKLGGNISQKFAGEIRQNNSQGLPKSFFEIFFLFFILSRIKREDVQELVRKFTLKFLRQLLKKFIRPFFQTILWKNR